MKTFTAFDYHKVDCQIIKKIKHYITNLQQNTFNQKRDIKQLFTT